MGFWVPSAALLPGERVVLQAAANHLPSKRSVGGQVTVTNRRMLFIPNRLDGLTGGRKIEVFRDTITGVQVAAPVRRPWVATASLPFYVHKSRSTGQASRWCWWSWTRTPYGQPW